MKLCEHHKIENAWKAIAWDSESYSGGQVLSSPPAGGNVFKIARLQQPRFTSLILVWEEISGRSPTCHISLGDRETAEKLCDLLNQHGVGKSFADIGNLEVDDDLNVV